ncbi:tRNA (guanine-N(7)-)-methyltransferase non-catalytic subunit WDR4 [Pelobates fuscus]|uniref:tRNA (guanine-N(7)-)-methyltransferase non-catalytic subunit WDR4 n=1 Tax=Pelobates fuscus TaxID=191477 RepID=UPI002FE45F32
MLRLRAGRLSVTGGSGLLGGTTGLDPAPFFLFDCSLLEKPAPMPGQDSSEAVSDQILAAAFSPSGEFFAVTDDRKRLVLFQTQPAWEKVSVRSVSRRCTALTFSACERHILAADKSGDVFSFSVIRAQEEGRLELGHLSMLLDVAMSPDGKHIITCDRDEKIRVSLWDSPHVISTFCLGHTEFVSQLLVLPGAQKLLLSGSGDGFLRLWEYDAGVEIHNWNLSRSAESEGSQRFAISRMACCTRGRTVAVLCEGIPGIYLFSVSAAPRLVHTQYLSLSSTPLDLDFDDSASLWVLSSDANKPLVQYRQTDLHWQPVQENGSFQSFSEAIRKNWDLLQGSATPENRFKGLYKVMCDNMASYLRKKEARLETEKRKTTSDHPDLASKLRKTER